MSEGSIARTGHARALAVYVACFLPVALVGCIEEPRRATAVAIEDAADDEEQVVAAAPQAITTFSASYAVAEVAWVDSFAPTTAHAGAIKAGQAGPSHSNGTGYGLVRWNTPSYYSNASVTSASISFTLQVPGNAATMGGSNPSFYMYTAGSSWSGATATWNAQPSWGTPIGGQYVGLGTSVTYASGSYPTLTTACQNWSTGAWANYGLKFYANSAGAFSMRRFTAGNLNVGYTCNSGYAWNGSWCQQIYCNATTPSNGYLNSSWAYYGNAASYGCNTGYALQGSAPTCGGSAIPGTWNGSEPWCQQIYCWTTAPANGSYGTGYAYYGNSDTYFCNAGFALTGSAPTCGGTTVPGTWSGAHPTCAAISCNTSAPMNGTVSSTTAAYNGTVNYSCNVGYARVGASSAQCGGTTNPGTWSAPAPTCALISCNASAPANGSVSASSATYGNTVTYSCNPGYQLSGTATPTCGGMTNPGTWSAAQPTCVQISCTTSAPTNGTVSSTTATWGNFVTYGCNAGYVRVGASSATCTGTMNPGTWSASAPTCQLISCNATTPSNGSVSAPSATYGNSVVYSCNAGYAVTGSAPTCGGATNPGTWSGAEPTCTQISCNATAPANGSVSAPSATYGNSVVYSCAAGYAVTGTAPTCGGTTNPGTWSGAQPTCTPISCNAATPANGSVSAPTAAYGGSVVYSCNAGYVVTGSAPTCGGTTNPGTWSGAQPTCTQITCNASAPANGSVSAPTAVYGASVVYSCNAGFAVTGIAPTCGGVSNPGTWSGAQPTCTPISCNATAPTNGTVAASSVGYGSGNTWSCNSGFEISMGVTSSMLTCGGTTNPGTWSGTPPATCVNINECTRTPGVCGLGSCSDTVGAYNCTCPGGYTFDGTTCVQTNACLASTPCDPNATCTPIGMVSFSCACNTGYTGDGVTCAADPSFCGSAPPSVSNAGVPTVSGGVAGGSTQSYQATATYTCDTGYSKSGADSTCTAAGTWSAAPSCDPIASFCPAPVVILHAPAPVVSGGVAGGATESYQATAAYTCDAGYTKSGTDSVCGVSGWSSAPSCSATPNYCGSPASVANASAPSVSGGAAGGATNSLGASASVTCSTGFVKMGVDQVCTAGGAWSAAPVCVSDDSFCGGAPPTVTNASSVSVSGGVGGGSTTSFNATAAYTCDVGYSKTGADSTCQATHLWSAPPTCDVISTFCAAAPPSVLHAGTPTVSGGIAGTNTPSYNATAAYTCDVGYAKTGSDATCQSNGTWSAGPNCVAVASFCAAAPPMVLNAAAPTIGGGAAGGTTQSYGATAAYTCDTGYSKSGSDSTCQSDGSWSGAPTCTPIGTFCAAAPATVTNGTLTSVSGGVAGGTSQSFGAVAAYVCDSGFAKTGSDSTCQASGSWSAAPTCTAVASYCPTAPVVANGSLTSVSGGVGGGSTTSLGALAAYDCDTGFGKSGADATCQLDTTWTAAPTCTAIVSFCGAAPAVTNSASSIVSGGVAGGASTSYGATATYTCASGYAKAGADPTCQADTDWSTPPTCNEIDECTADTDNCSPNASCANTPGSFTCTCSTGYGGDGVTCIDVDECAANTDNCSVNGFCTNTPGSFTCGCNNGYAGDGVTCTDVNECLFTLPTPAVCDPNALCTNNTGGYSCQCNTGYQGSGQFCIDVNDCVGAVCGTNEVCVNQPGVPHTCECAEGYARPVGMPAGACVAACGDGRKNVGEECDDANTTNGDGCSSTCLIERGYACHEPTGQPSTCAPTCGDGHIDPPYEDCDDGASNTDTVAGACRTTCRRDGCGDGVVTAPEECDLGLDNSDTTADTCRTDCRNPFCGDGVTDFDAGEVCDPGGDTPLAASACSTTLCRVPDAGIDAGHVSRPEPSRCSCRLAGAPDSESGPLVPLALGAFVALVATRRKRRRG